jgi:hypothetical protein
MYEAITVKFPRIVNVCWFKNTIKPVKYNKKKAQDGVQTLDLCMGAGTRGLKYHPPVLQGSGLSGPTWRGEWITEAVARGRPTVLSVDP